MKKIDFKLGELFCGPGGVAEGAKNAKIKTNELELSILHSWASDHHVATCDTYKNNFPDTLVKCVDVNELDIQKLPKIDAFAYGFPCNDFSIVGESKGLNGEFGALYTFGVKVIDKFNPKFFVAENVGGLISANNGNAFNKITNDLSSAGKHGYILTLHKYKFEQYGIPQARHRIIIVGIRKDLKIDYKIPAPTHLDRFVTSRDALENPPIPKDSANNERKKQSERVVERLKYIKPGKNIWQSEMPKEFMLNVKSAKLSQIYKRLDPDKPSYTITGSGGGGTHGYHYKEPRALTNRERARLQTFPDSFIFKGSNESVRRQIGMAVPPLGAKIIFDSILKSFAGINYESIPANIKKG